MANEKTNIQKNRYLVFEYCQKSYFLPSGKIESVSRLSNITYKEHPNRHILGMTVVRGEIYSCLSIELSNEGKYIIILKYPSYKIGLLADKIFGFRDKPPLEMLYIDVNQLESNNFEFHFLSKHKWFHFADGRSASSLLHFLEDLKAIDARTFSHHVRKDKNDFSEWISHIIGNRDLAESIRKMAKKEDMIPVIEKYVES